DHLGDGIVVVQRHQHVGGLEVAVDDPFLMGVLHRLAHAQEQLQALARRRPRVSMFSSQYVVMGTPLTNSMTKYGRPDSVVPPSRTLAMFGWSIKANACRSASKRAITC